MRRWLGILTCGLLLGAVVAPAFAEDEEEESESFTGRKLPPAQVPSPSGRGTISAETAQAMGIDREYPNIVYIGAEALDLKPKYVHEVRLGLEKLFLRDYKGTREYFTELDAKNPGSAMGPVADLLVWQALMLENFDFKYDKQYETSSKRARTALEAALAKPGQEGFERFLMAGVVGLESIHTMRKEQYLPALQLAFQAMDEVTKAKEAAPKFDDLLLADGIYNYWRTVVTMTSKVLPDFGDHRVEGIQQMQAVEQSGLFLGPPATLSLAFSWIEENDLKRAVTSCLHNRRAYPDNVVNNLLLGRVYTSLRKYDSALGVYDDITRVAPDNKRVHYYRGVALLRAGRVDEAGESLQTYLAVDYLETWQRSAAQYRLGQVYFRQKKYDKAEAEWKASVKLDGNAGSKARLERMKELKKQGKLE